MSKMKRLLTLGFLVVAAPTAAFPQSAPDSEIEKRLRALEAEVQALKAELVALRTAQAAQAATPVANAAAPPAQPTEAPSGSGAAVTAAEEHRAGPFPEYGTPSAKTFNPDIGVIGNFLGAVGRSGGGSESMAPLPAFTLQESEASFQAVVDPFARADFFLAVGEEGIEVEEGYITFPTVPGGLLVKAGRMRATFGRLNTFHNHTLPWVDRPLVMFNLLGGSTGDPDTGIKDAGISVSRLLPIRGLFVEATGEVFRGDSGTLFSSTKRQDVSAVAHLRAYTDISESANLEVGGSYARGHNDQGSAYLTQLFGTDITLRWRPLRRAICHSFAGRAELVWSNREHPTGRQEAWGGFVSADYRLTRRWFLGGRYDWSDRARDPDVRDSGFSLVATFWPSEFTQLRGQYRRTRFGEGATANEFLFQTLFTIGAHGAHPF
jgi:hypothetical protein